MDDIIFERDYREAESGEYDEWCDEVFDRAVNGGMLKAYSDAMDKIPKIIIPEDKKNYEYLLERCDAFVERHRGRIEGIVDYHHWHSEINMFLPFAEFGDPEDLGFLKEIADKSHSICFSPDKDGGIRVHIFINYFDELMPEEAKQLVEYDAIMSGLHPCWECRIRSSRKTDRIWNASKTFSDDLKPKPSLIETMFSMQFSA